MCSRPSYRPPSLLHSPSHLFQHTFQRTHLCTPSSIHMASPRKTCPGNATKHPGLIGKTSTVCRNSAQVNAAAAAKRATKDAKDTARTANICHAAEFESTALDNDDLIDATPRPNFTPNANPHHTGKVPEMYCDSETQEITD